VKSLRLNTKFVVFGLIAVVTLSFVSAGVISNAPQASAISRVGPDSSEFDNNARFALEDNQFVENVKKIVIPIYYKERPSNDGVVTVEAYSFAYERWTGDTSKVKFSSPNMIEQGSDKETKAVRSDLDFKVKFPETVDSATGYYKVLITAKMEKFGKSNELVNFRLRVASPGLIGYSTSNGSSFAIANESRCDSADSRGCNKTYDYKIPFAPNCKVTKTTEVTAKIYDGDNGENGAQPKKFTVTIRDTTDDKNISWKKGKGFDDGDKGTAPYVFNIQPGHKYQFRVANVYTNNVLQFSLPYDSIFTLVDCKYELTPEVSLSDTVVEANSSELGVSYEATNSGQAINGQWQLAKCIVPAGAPATAYSKANDNTSNAVATYNARGATCTQAGAGTNTAFKQEDVTQLGNLANQEVGDLAAGSRICYALAVSPPSSSAASNAWRHAAPACALVSKKPKVQVLGNDLIVGKGRGGESVIRTGVARQTTGGVTRTFGSWGEYGIAASGQIFGIASASAYATGSTVTSCEGAALLMFTHGGEKSCSTAGERGFYSLAQSLPSIGGQFTGGRIIEAGRQMNLSAFQGVYTTTGDISINATQDIPKGKWVVVKAPGSTVTIKTNINYTKDTLNAAAEIPQILIIARNILIEGDVTNIDAWLIAKDDAAASQDDEAEATVGGAINTCSDVAADAPLTINLCSNKLTVNGPVVAEHLYLRRTAGVQQGAKPGEPAEIFNLRPDAYLWATNWSASAGRLPTVYSKELPPRF